jgi:hypothetical protein
LVSLLLLLAADDHANSVEDMEDVLFRTDLDDVEDQASDDSEDEEDAADGEDEFAAFGKGGYRGFVKKYRRLSADHGGGELQFQLQY